MEEAAAADVPGVHSLQDGNPLRDRQGLLEQQVVAAKVR